MSNRPLQLHLPQLEPVEPRANGLINQLDPSDRAFHAWYRFVLSFPPHLVRDYLADFGLTRGQTVLDPFCGTGTTVVEARLNGLASFGIEAMPFSHFASSVKVKWDIDADALLARAAAVAAWARAELARQGIDDSRSYPGDIDRLDLMPLDTAARKLLIKNSISPLPLHKALILLDILNRRCAAAPEYQHMVLALATALVGSISNLRFGPEIGVGKQKRDVPVIASWLAEIERMAADLHLVQGRSFPDARVLLGDTRQIGALLDPESVDAVITSPPYPNEKDYSRTVRLESVLLGLVTSKESLRAFKQDLVRSNTRSVYKDDQDDTLVADHEGIQRLAEEIEERRIQLGKTSGFERLYPRVTRLYFGGMMRHLADLRTVLRPGAQLAYVVGDQASYLRVMIRTGQLLAEVARDLGYEVARIDLFRTRFATATQQELREEVVVLRWPKKGMWMMTHKLNRYQQLVEKIFLDRYREGDREVSFERADLEQAASELDIKLPKNLGDIIYSFRYRTELPDSIRDRAPEGEEWVIRPAGRGRYEFALAKSARIVPSAMLAQIKIPDSTPGVIARYALDDEQALLAKLRYNRLIDLFTGLTCYPLQSHLRTTVAGVGQVETDEVYIGLDKRGVHYVLPVQAKGARDWLGIVQVEQDFALCARKFPGLVVRPIAAQFMADDVIALFEFVPTDEGVRVSSEAHYHLVRPEELSADELQKYRARLVT